MGGTKVLSEARAADVLEHADAHDLVESLALQFAIVAQLHTRSIRDAGGGDAPLCLVALLLAQRYPESARSEAFGRAYHERAPAAADVEKPLAGVKAQLAQGVVQLGRLRIVERFAIALPVRTRIHHIAIEEAAVEINRLIVMETDRGAVAGAGVNPPAQARLA